MIFFIAFIYNHFIYFDLKDFYNQFSNNSPREVSEMLADLIKVQENLFTPEVLDNFLKAHPIHEILKLLNKSSKKETINRLQYLLSRIGRSKQFREQLMNQCLSEKPENQQEFTKYVMSDRSDAYFAMLLQNATETLKIIQHNSQICQNVFRMLSSKNGLKMIKIISQMYKKYGDHDCLYAAEVRKVLKQGTQIEDSQVKMRYVEVIANISIESRGFKFLESAEDDSLLSRVLQIYKTDDILLKLNIVQVISVLGKGLQSSKVLYDHKIWKQIEKQATDDTQQFYIRKSLLILLVDMCGQGHVEMSQKLRKSLQAFLEQNINSKGEYVQAALQLIQHCFHQLETIKIVISSMKIFQRYCILARTTEDRFKAPFIDTIISLTGPHHHQSAHSIIINILNCVGNPNLCSSTSHNLHANNHMIQGIGAFAKWLINFLQLPFEQFEIRCLTALANIIDYLDVAYQIFKDERITKYLTKKVSNLDNKVLKDRKAAVIKKILLKGQNKWKGLELEYYCHMLQKQLKGSSMEQQYALDVE